MKRIVIQLQPERNESISCDEAQSIMTELGLQAIVDQGEDNGIYINLTIKTENPKADCMKLKNNLLITEPYRRSSIATCEGKNRWTDYLLLHHYDRTMITDDFTNH